VICGGIARRERARVLAIANLVAMGAVMVFAIGSVLVSLF